MFSERVPVPVWLAAAAFSLLLVEPQVGSSASHVATAAVPCPAVANEPGSAQDAALWHGYRTASRQWTAAKPDPVRATGVLAVPILVR
jgi:hypothetical protein